MIDDTRRGDLEAYADHHEITLVQAYAADLVLGAIKSCVEDDLDEDGVFPACSDGLHPEHEAALDLAKRLADTIRDNPAMILSLIVPV